MVELQQVSRTYKVGKDTITALNDVTLDIEEGQLVVVLGPSGSGKTTLLNVIGGIDSCQGKIFVNGIEISKLHKGKLGNYRRSTVGFVFQFFNLLPVYNALENVEYAVELSQKLPRKKITKQAEEYLKAVGMYEKRFLFPSQLSGGEQQRIAAARAFAKDPFLLLCDEPTGELSVKEGKMVLFVLQQMIKKNPHLLVLLVTHNQEIARIANKVIRLRSGVVDQIIDQSPVDAQNISW
jgi:putative ABC transport system ATP-binding protein